MRGGKITDTTKDGSPPNVHCSRLICTLAKIQGKKCYFLCQLIQSTGNSRVQVIRFEIFSFFLSPSRVSTSRESRTFVLFFSLSLLLSCFDVFVLAIIQSIEYADEIRKKERNDIDAPMANEYHKTHPSLCISFSVLLSTFHHSICLCEQ